MKKSSFSFILMIATFTTSLISGCYREKEDKSPPKVVIPPKKVQNQNQAELKIGQFYYISSADGLYLTQNRENGFAFVSGTKERTFFQVESTTDNKVFLKSGHGQYISAQSDSSIGTASKPMAWEAFSMIYIEGKRLVLKTHHGTFLGLHKNRTSLGHLKTPIEESSLLFFNEVYDSKSYRETIINAKPPANSQKIVWTFWESGQGTMPDFYKLNVQTWGRVLDSSWTIRVLNSAGSQRDENHIFNYITAGDLPNSFEHLPHLVKTDAVRLAILKKQGGVWIDPSYILLKSLDQFCWNEIANPNLNMLLAGFYSDAYGSNHLHRKDFLEMGLLGVRQNNAFIDLWHQTFNEYWNTKQTGVEIWNHPLFKRLDLNNFVRYGNDFRNLLSAHVAFRKLIEEDFIMRTIWINNMTLRKHSYSANLVATKLGWDEGKVFEKLIREKDEDLVREIFETSTAMAFSGNLSKPFNAMSQEEILGSNGTLAQIYERIFTN